MRKRRKDIKSAKVTDDALRKKASLALDLLPERSEDVKSAELMAMESRVSAEEASQSLREKIDEEQVLNLNDAANILLNNKDDIRYRIVLK